MSEHEALARFHLGVPRGTTKAHILSAHPASSSSPRLR
jgi:hypothetical protein